MPSQASTTSRQPEVDGMQGVGQGYAEQPISASSKRLICHSWEKSTRRQYSCALKRWKAFAARTGANPNAPTPCTLTDFIADLFDEQVGYSYLNTARCAVASLASEPQLLSKHHMVKRVMKGAFALRPALPRGPAVWDPETVLNHIKDPTTTFEDMPLRVLSEKLVMLLALLTAQRIQSLKAFDLNDIFFKKTKVTITINSKLKQTRAGAHLTPIVLEAYPDCPSLCVVTMLLAYVRKTAPLRSSSQLLVTWAKPHGACSTATISRWLKSTLRSAGVAGFTAHSTRSASTSKATESTVPIDCIMKAAGWSQQSTFTRHYKRQITKNFGSELLKACRPK